MEDHVRAKHPRQCRAAECKRRINSYAGWKHHYRASPHHPHCGACGEGFEYREEVDVVRTPLRPPHKVSPISGGTYAWNVSTNPWFTRPPKIWSGRLREIRGSRTHRRLEPRQTLRLVEDPSRPQKLIIASMGLSHPARLTRSMQPRVCVYEAFHRNGVCRVCSVSSPARMGTSSRVSRRAHSIRISTRRVFCKTRNDFLGTFDCPPCGGCPYG
ncbi:hypothetical protein FIBSPDRAFT_269876 [Athelia psychrophila]|uniref:Uncharacterized protein n=1 Tax=Athelia psychrophila TaxID=1759441 RepID=A0A165X148_9AGAM|nr:hypothetical protein FIBSPDRAFT_269876 [Fibularhizoctonia sp. CBS 109695]